MGNEGRGKGEDTGHGGASTPSLLGTMQTLAPDRDDHDDELL